MHGQLAGWRRKPKRQPLQGTRRYAVCMCLDLNCGLTQVCNPESCMQWKIALPSCLIEDIMRHQLPQTQNLRAKPCPFSRFTKSVNRHKSLDSSSTACQLRHSSCTLSMDTAWNCILCFYRGGTMSLGLVKAPVKSA